MIFCILYYANPDYIENINEIMLKDLFYANILIVYAPGLYLRQTTQRKSSKVPRQRRLLK